MIQINNTDYGYLQTLTTEISIENITNHRTYTAPDYYDIIYVHWCYDPEVKLWIPYIGSTDISIKKRCGTDFKGYTCNPNTNTKFAKFLRKYGYVGVKSEILRIIRTDLRATAEQEEIEKHNAIELGYNTYNAVKAIANPPKSFKNKANEKNNPTEISIENVQLTMKHKYEPTDFVIMNKGLYLHFFKDMVLKLHTPGMKGHVDARYKCANGRITTKTALRYLVEDLGIELKYGPDGCHNLTLDNIYLVGTKTSLRTFLDTNPEYIKRVSYLTFGNWDN